MKFTINTKTNSVEEVDGENALITPTGALVILSSVGIAYAAFASGEWVSLLRKEESKIVK